MDDDDLRKLAKRLRDIADRADPMVTLRMPPSLLAAVEAWAADRDDQPTRSEAIRRLLEIGLRKRRSPKSLRSVGKRLYAASIRSAK